MFKITGNRNLLKPTFLVELNPSMCGLQLDLSGRCMMCIELLVRNLRDLRAAAWLVCW